MFDTRPPTRNPKFADTDTLFFRNGDFCALLYNADDGIRFQGPAETIKFNRLGLVKDGLFDATGKVITGKIPKRDKKKVVEDLYENIAAMTREQMMRTTTIRPTTTTRGIRFETPGVETPQPEPTRRLGIPAFRRAGVELGAYPALVEMMARRESTPALRARLVEQLRELHPTEDGVQLSQRMSAYGRLFDQWLTTVGVETGLRRAARIRQVAATHVETRAILRRGTVHPADLHLITQEIRTKYPTLSEERRAVVARDLLIDLRSIMGDAAENAEF